MALDSSRVRLAVTGSVAVALVGTPGPVDALTPLPWGWYGLGYISDQGVSEAMTGEPTEIVPWRSGLVSRNSPGTTRLKYSFGLLEVTVEGLNMFYGQHARPGDSSHMLLSEGCGVPVAMVLTVVDGFKVSRHWLPRVEVVERDERVFAATKAPVMGMTVQAHSSETLMVDGVVSTGEVFYSEPLESSGRPADPPVFVPVLGPFSVAFDPAFEGV